MDLGEWQGLQLIPPIYFGTQRKNSFYQDSWLNPSHLRFFIAEEFDIKSELLIVFLFKNDKLWLLPELI